MPDERISALLEIGIAEDKARQALSAIDSMKKGLTDANKAAEQATQALRKMAEQGEKLRNVGAVMAGLGAGLIGPLILAAQAYETRYKGLEKTANDFARAQQRSTDANAAFGRVATSVLIPIMNQVADFQERIAAFAEKHPELVKAAATAGIGLAAGGAGLIAAGTAISTVSRAAELLKNVVGNGGQIASLAGNIAQATVLVGAFVAGLKLGEIAVNELGKATKNEQLEHFKLADALKTAREIIGLVVLGLTKLVEQAKVTGTQLILLIVAAGQRLKSGIEDIVDQIVTGIRKTLIDLQPVIDGVKAGFNEMVGKIRDGFIDIINGIIGMVNSVIEKLPGFLNVGKIGTIAKPEASAGGGVSFGATPEEQKAQLDKDYQTRKKAREEQDQKLAAAMAAADKAQQDSAAATIKKRADEVANFAETGSLGTALDGVVKTVKDFIGAITGTGDKAKMNTNGSAVSPEAVRAFIERNKAMAASDRQYKIDQQNLAYEFNKNEQKTKRDQAIELGKMALDESRAERDAQAKFNFDRTKAQRDFRLNEAAIDRKAQLDALQRQKEHNLKLTDLAASRDVAGFVQEMRSFALSEDNTRKQEAFDKAERQKKFDQDMKDQQAQYDFDRAQEKIHNEDKRKDLKDQWAREERERKLAYDEQLRALKYKHDLEKEAIDRAFAEQLASLNDNLAGLNAMQNNYYTQQSAALAAFVDQNKAKLQELYASGMSGGSTGGSASNSASYSAYQGASTIDYLSSNADARNAFASQYLGSFASGLDYAPHDGWAYIHRGEGVTTAAENASSGGDVHFNGDINIGAGNNVTKADVQDALRQLAGQIRSVS